MYNEYFVFLCSLAKETLEYIRLQESGVLLGLLEPVMTSLKDKLPDLLLCSSARSFGRKTDDLVLRNEDALFDGFLWLARHGCVVDANEKVWNGMAALVSGATDLFGRLQRLYWTRIAALFL
jgi:hypothetical protein